MRPKGVKGTGMFPLSARRHVIDGRAAENVWLER